jgi:hypothetical protein
MLDLIFQRQSLQHDTQAHAAEGSKGAFCLALCCHWALPSHGIAIVGVGRFVLKLVQFFLWLYRKTPQIERNGFFKLEIGLSGFGLFSVSVEEWISAHIYTVEDESMIPVWCEWCCKDELDDVTIVHLGSRAKRRVRGFANKVSFQVTLMLLETHNFSLQEFLFYCLV